MLVYSITGQVYTMGQSLKVYNVGLQYYRTGSHYGTKFKGGYLLVYSITGQVHTMGQSLKVDSCGFTVLQDMFTLWDKV